MRLAKMLGDNLLPNLFRTSQLIPVSVCLSVRACRSFLEGLPTDTSGQHGAALKSSASSAHTNLPCLFLSEADDVPKQTFETP